MANNKFNAEQLLQMAKLLKSSGEPEEKQADKITDFAKSNMNAEQRAKLNEILGDAKAINKLMESKQAQALLKNLTNKK